MNRKRWTFSRNICSDSMEWKAIFHVNPLLSECEMRLSALLTNYFPLFMVPLLNHALAIHSLLYTRFDPAFRMGSSTQIERAKKNDTTRKQFKSVNKKYVNLYCGDGFRIRSALFSILSIQWNLENVFNLFILDFRFVCTPLKTEVKYCHWGQWLVSHLPEWTWAIIRLIMPTEYHENDEHAFDMATER